MGISRKISDVLPVRLPHVLAGIWLVAIATVLNPGIVEAQSIRVTSGEYSIASRNSVRDARRARFRSQSRGENNYQRRKTYQPRNRYNQRNTYKYSTAPKRRKSTRRRRNKKRTAIPSWNKASAASKDPIQIIVSLPDQRITVYKGSEAVVTSRVSSGKPGNDSPSGVFSILQKNRRHRSNIYSNAPMPYMQRLTWSGIALHGSNSVPNYPASHGCIRLPHSFASQLFKYTGMGGHVIVANEKVAPTEITHATLFQPTPRAMKVVAKADISLNATDATSTATEEEKRSTAPLRILITRRTGQTLLRDVQNLLNEISFNAGDADGYMGPDTASAIRRFQSTYGLKPNGMMSDELLEKLYEVTGNGTPKNGHLYVRQNFKPIFDAPVAIRGGDTPLGSHLFTAMHFDAQAKKARWLSVSLTKGSPKKSRSRKRRRWKKAELAGGLKSENSAVYASSAAEALDRMEIASDIRKRLSEMLTPGTSLAITNDGISKETTPKGSDFVLLMQ